MYFKKENGESGERLCSVRPETVNMLNLTLKRKKLWQRKVSFFLNRANVRSLFFSGIPNIQFLFSSGLCEIGDASAEADNTAFEGQ